MNTKFKLTFAMLAGAAIGAMAVNGLHAQSRAPIYVVSELTVSNLDAYGKEYAPKVQALIKKSGGRFAAIGGSGGAGAGKVTAFDGEAPIRSTVQIWDSLEQYQAYRNAPEYKEIRTIGENTRNSAFSPSMAWRSNTREITKAGGRRELAAS